MTKIKDLFENNCVHYFYTMEKKNVLVMKPLTETIVYNKLQ